MVFKKLYKNFGREQGTLRYFRKKLQQRNVILYKILLLHFKALPGFKSYAIETLVNIIQNEVSLSEAEAHQCKWAATVNWKGGAGKNIEIHLL